MRDVLLTEMNSRKMKQKDFASLIEISPSALSMYFKEERDFAFQTMTQIIRKLFPETEQDVMKKYIKSLKLQDARHALEYCYMNGQFGVFETKLKELSSGNDTDKEWAEVYQLLNLRRTKKLTPSEIVARSKRLNVSSPEMIFMKRMIEISGLYDLRKYEYIMDYLDEIEYDLEQIKSEYIRSSYEVRLGQVIAHISLRSNQIEKCREYCHLLLNKSNDLLIKASIYHTLGHSYILESFDKAIENIHKALEYYVELGKKEYVDECKSSLNFVMNLYGEFPVWLDFAKIGIGNHHEIIHYYIKNNQLSKAKEMLLNTDVSDSSIEDIAFHYYYSGLAFENEDHFFESIYYFNKQGDAFFSELPRRELRKRGVSESVLRATRGRESWN